ncbi:MAG TPA: hypothetical protein VL400_04885 [Polyangiaceae bacterium]|jgi:hypothetical protein|nr:hypothetical protein [Polyangiaceae bacterium]
MDSPRKLPSKKEVLATYLERDSARVFLDPRKDGVVVPKHLGKQAELVLRLGHDLRPPIPDLDIGDAGVTCTLSFNRSPFLCHLPWSAVFAIISDDVIENRGVVWPEDVPVESQLVSSPPKKPKLAPAPPPQPALAVTPRRPEPRPRAARLAEPQPLVARAERDGEGSGASTKGGDAPKKAKRELPPYLRVVK